MYNAGWDRWYENRASPTEDGGVAVYFRDVTDQRRAAAALRESEERFRRYFELGLIGMAITSPAKGILEVNDELCRTLGYTRDELLRTTWAALTHPDDVAADVALFDRVTAGEIDGYVLDKRWVRKDGRVIDGTVSVKCLRAEGGAVDYFVALLQDVTDRKRADQALRESEERFRNMADHAPVGVWVSDPGGACTYLNEWWHRLTGQPPGQGAGFGWLECVHPDDRAGALAAFRAANGRREAFRLEYRLRRHDGEYRWAIDSAAPRLGPAGEFLGCVGSVLDVTDEKRQEAALWEARDELEGRVAGRTAELAAANDAVRAEVRERRRAEVARTDLLRRLATAQEDERRRVARDLHDQLGQQLTALTLGLQAARDRGADPPDLARLQRAAEEVARGVHDVALRLRPTALDDFGLAAALRSAVEEWARGAGAEVTLDAAGLGPARLPPEVETALYRVVQEAVHNALKHAGPRRVSVLVERRNGHATVIIEDDGAGFDAGALLAHPPAGRLGLVGMRERLALVGGTLEVESAPGSGTTVFARVPIPTTDGGA